MKRSNASEMSTGPTLADDGARDVRPPDRPAVRLQENGLELETDAQRCSRATISCARRTRSARQRSRNDSSSGECDGRK